MSRRGGGCGDEGRDSRGPKNIGQNLLLLLVVGNAAVVAPPHGVPNTLIQNHPAASVFVVLTFWNLSHQHLWIMHMG